MKKTMTDNELQQFVKNIGRTELHDEMEEINKNKEFKGSNLVKTHDYPHYLKAVRVSLVALGYDAQWVDTKVRKALEDRYWR